MNPREEAQASILRIAVLVALLATAVSLAAVADQLQWNVPTVCEDAARAIGRASLLISYCSLAGADFVELWWVRNIAVVDTAAQGLSEVRVLARSLYRSREAFSAHEFPVAGDRWVLDQSQDSGWFPAGIDLAYVYIQTAGSSFECLGKVLGLDCLVGVETIRLPDDMLATLSARTPPVCAVPRWIPRMRQHCPASSR